MLVPPRNHHARNPHPRRCSSAGFAAGVLAPALLLGATLLGAGLPGTATAGPKPTGAAEDADLAVAKKARASVVRIRWRDERYSRRTVVRHAVVVRADGLLLMAGPPIAGRGTLRAKLADGRELDAEVLASDVQTALSLLRIRAANLPALTLREEPARRAVAADAQKPDPKRAIPKEPAPKKAVPTKGAEKGKADVPLKAKGAKRAPELRFPAIGLRLVMVTSDGSVAVGPVRRHRRYGKLVDPVTRHPVKTTGLVGVTLSAVDQDAGAPLLDAQGRLAGLLVGRKATIAPEKGEAAAAVGLRLRPEPTEAVAVPASVIRLVWPLLERFRRIPRAGLGVRTLEMDDALRAQLDLKTGGHVVRVIEPGSAAARAGLQLHDVIVGVNGRRIEPGTSFHDVLLPYRPGTSVKLGVYRTGDSITLDVKLERLR